MAGEIVISGWRQQSSTEVRPWGLDTLLAEDSGDTPATATATLIDLLTGASFPTGLSGSPSITGTVVTQTVTGLVAGHNYRLVLSVNMGGSKVTAVGLNLTCPF